MTEGGDVALAELGPDERDLVRLVLAAQLGLWTELRRLHRARFEGLDAAARRRWREALLQLHLFAGIPRVVEAFDVLAEEGGLGGPDPDEESGADRFDAGRALFERIYADGAAAVRGRLATFHPALFAWIEGHAYGRVLARDGLDVARRELLAVAALAALDQPRQLAAHVRGARRVGVARRALDQLLELAAGFLSAEALGRARDVVAHYG